MNDLISRQAAIDTLCHVDEYNGRSIEAIRNLPSAQQKIIHCVSCKYRNTYRFPPQYDERDYCEIHEKTVQLDWYCSWADRRIKNKDGEKVME